MKTDGDEEEDDGADQSKDEDDGGDQSEDEDAGDIAAKAKVDKLKKQPKSKRRAYRGKVRIFFCFVN